MLLAKSNMDSLDLSPLSEEQISRIEQLKEKLPMDGTGGTSIYDFGVDVSKRIGDFSTDLLSKVKVKDSPEIEELFSELTKNINSIDVENLTIKKPNFFQRIFKTSEIKEFIKKHDSIVPVIDQVKTNLARAQYQLKKDIETCQLYHEKNLQNIEDLDYHILAGRLRMKEMQEDFNSRSATVDKDDILAVEELSILHGQIEQLETRITNLALLRDLAIQNIRKISIIADGDSATINKISTSITMTIPAWESQMMLAVLIARARTASTLDKNFTDLTNRLIETSASYLHMTATEIAKQVERGVIDIESLKKSGKEIEATYKDVAKIRQDARKDRATVIQDLKQIENSIASTVLLLEDPMGA